VWKASQSDSGARPQVKVGAKVEHLSMFNPRNPIWQGGDKKDRFSVEKEYHDEEQLIREGTRARIEVDPDLEDQDE